MRAVARHPTPFMAISMIFWCVPGCKYTWRDIGSSYLMSDLPAAYLWAQLEAADRINQQRLALWQNYYDALAPLAKAGRIELPSIPDGCVQNAHMFYIKLRDIDNIHW